MRHARGRSLGGEERKLALIVAMTSDRLIGDRGGLPWHLPRDLRRFKEITMGGSLVMGRRTWESLGRCLPGRQSVLITRRKAYNGAGALVATRWQQALRLADAGETTFFIGGAAIYRHALPIVDVMYVTFVDATVTGDTYFPAVDWQHWHAVDEASFPPDAKHRWPVRFVEFRRHRRAEI